MSTKTKTRTLDDMLNEDHPLGKHPDLHYVNLEINHGQFDDSKIEEYLDRQSLAAEEEGQAMYRVVADPRKDENMRRFTGSSRKVLLACTKASQLAWEKHWAEKATAVLRPKNDPNESSFTTFVDAQGNPFQSDSPRVFAAEAAGVF